MKLHRKWLSCLVVLAVAAICLLVLPTRAEAATSGDFTYEVSNGEVMITDFPMYISGELVIPSKIDGYPVTGIGEAAFAHSNLSSITIPDSVTNIDSLAFRECENLTSITIPDSVTSIGSAAFAYCHSLTSVTIGSGVTSIDYRAFYCCTGLTSITISDSSVTIIDSDAFYNCVSLTSITIPDGVTTIGNGAFAWCESLTSITIPDSVTTIGEDAFWSCDGLISITIPDSVTTIGDDAFYYCDSLISITIPDSVTSIGSFAFYNCTSLTNVEIPGSGVQIGQGAFGNCTALETVTVPDSAVFSYYGSSFGGSSIKLIISCDRGVVGERFLGYQYGSGVRVYNRNAGIREVVISEGITEIHDDAFIVDNSSYSSETDSTELKRITLPSTLRSIGERVFYNCRGLTEIVLPDSVTSIGDSAFYYCTGLTSITIPDSVTTIDEEAFRYCTGLTSVIIPDGVTSIGNYAFCKCDSLTSITIPDSVTTIGYDAFAVCYSLTGITIPDSVTTIGNHAFSGCTGLTGIWVSEGNANYSNDSYGVLFNKDKTELICAPGAMKGSYIIPDSVTIIDSEAFYNCVSLTSITIPDSVTSIGYSAFENCTSLTSITIPDSVTFIGNSAFSGCTGLTSVIISDGVTRIDACTFSGCTALETVFYKGTQEQWAAITIGSDNESLTNAAIIYNYVSHTHTYKAVVIAPTCTTDGYTTYTCSVCGDTYVADETAALGHIFDQQVKNIKYRKSAATINSPAIFYKTCACGLSSKGHTDETFEYGQRAGGAVAQVGNTYYATIEEAIAASIENGDEVLLLKDLNTAKPLTLNGDVTINFNSFTYTVNEPIINAQGYAVAMVIGKDANVNLIGGRLQIRYNRRHLFNYLIENNGTLTTENIVLRGQNVYEPGPSEYTAAILNTGSVTLNAGTVVEIRVNAVNTTNANVTKDADIVLKEAKGYHWSADQTQLMPHVFDQEIVLSQYRKSVATINSPAIFYKTCSCGVNAKGFDENATFEYGNRLGGAAKVGNTYYASIEEAIAAAIENGGEVTLLKSNNSAKALVINGDVTIDFAGLAYTVSNTANGEDVGAAIIVANGASVTLKNGTIQIRYAARDSFDALIENNGELYVENIALKGTNVSAAGAVLVKGNAMTEGEGVTKADPAK